VLQKLPILVARQTAAHIAGLEAAKGTINGGAMKRMLQKELTASEISAHDCKMLLLPLQCNHVLSQLQSCCCCRRS
jgi:hypothetical protein